MVWKKNWYLVHRWLGLIVGLQLLAWSAGGFVFSILDIENVRGNLDRRQRVDPRLDLDRVRLSPGQAVDRVARHGIVQSALSTVTLKQRGERIAYELFGNGAVPLASVDATTGEVRHQISESEASDIALADFANEATVASVTLLEGEPPLEFRGGRMPVYQVILDHPKHPHLYICPVTGEVLKRRNKPWRIFDFFWMLHIMDYGERDNFNHWLLTGMSLLAIATSASGLALWWFRRPKWFRRSRAWPIDHTPSMK